MLLHGPWSMISLPIFLTQTPTRSSHLTLQILESPERSPHYFWGVPIGFIKYCKWLPFSSSSALGDVFSGCLHPLQMIPDSRSLTSPQALKPLPAPPPPGCHLFLAVPFLPGLLTTVPLYNISTFIKILRFQCFAQFFHPSSELGRTL